MKRLLFSLAAGAFALSLQAQTQPTTGVVGTMHDLSATGFAKQTDYAQVCKFCHSPHGANSGAAQLVPLWGHANTTATFTMYGAAGSTTNPNSQLRGTIDAQPSGPSLACLSCHDGTVAVNARYAGGYAPNYGNFNTASTNAADFTSSVVNGKTYGTLTKHTIGAQTKDANGNTVNGDLSTVHPIGVDYTGVNAELWASPKPGVKLFNNKVQCASCHDAHNWNGADGSSTGTFLRMTTNGSALCLACHNK
jgi:predicted CXXCH cytochrome family protein